MRDYGRDTLLTLNTRTGVKKNKTVNYSSYWMDFDDDQYDTKITAEDISNPERIVKLASVRRAVANFVRILTNDPTIKVVFSSGKESYTDGKEVVIAAEDDSKHFDSMVGLALHEGAHCLLSDFNMLRVLTPHRNAMTAAACFSPEIRKLIPDIQYINHGDKNEKVLGVVNSFQTMLGTIMNVIEDRRIDSYVYQNAAGYRPYYRALYDKYFFNADVTKSLKSDPSWRVPSFENYTNWMINLFHPNFDPNALPGLKQIVNIIDLSNIRRFDITQRMPESFTDWKLSNEKTPWFNTSYTSVAFLVEYNTLPLLWRAANDILLVILQHIAASEMQKKDGDEGQTVTIDINGNSIEMDIDENGLQNLDMGMSSQPAPGKFNQDKAKKAIENIKKVMNGQNRRKKIKSKERADVEQLESAEAKIVEAGDKIVGNFPCLVTRKLNKQIMLSEWFPFARKTHNSKGGLTLTSISHYERAVTAGVRMGQLLAHRLQVRNDPIVTHYTRQNHGKIDRRILSQLGMEIESVFKRTTVDKFRPVMLHLSLDASGSMGGDKWAKVITVATALAFVSSKISNIETVITIRGDHNIPMVCVIYDSRKDNFQKARTLFPMLSPCGSTPEGLCYKATMDLITECASEYDTYFINFSDGEPGTTVHRNGVYKNYGGTDAHNHTRRQVQVMREAGVKVLSYFIGWRDTVNIYTDTSARVFRTMYGDSAAYVNVSNATEVLRTLNKLLLKKGD